MCNHTHRAAVGNLRAVLNQNPNISTLIHKVHISLALPGRIISAVLPFLERLRHLVLGRCDDHIDWEELGPEVETTLISFLRSRVFESVERIHISYIPAPFFHHLSQVNTLKMEAVHIVNDPEYDNLEPPPIMRLGAVHLSQGVIMSSQWPCKHPPNLHQCSFQRRYGPSVICAQHIIMSSLDTIGDIIWYNYHDPESSIRLARLPNLRRLSFVTDNYERYRTTDAEAMWNSIAKVLRNSAVARNLEELNMVIKASRVVASQCDSRYTLFDARSSWWQDIDTVLGNPSHAPNLFKVHVGLDSSACDTTITKSNFLALISQRLPLLEGYGVLSVELYNGFDWQWLL